MSVWEGHRRRSVGLWLLTRKPCGWGLGTELMSEFQKVTGPLRSNAAFRAFRATNSEKQLGHFGPMQLFDSTKMMCSGPSKKAFTPSARYSQAIQPSNQKSHFSWHNLWGNNSVYQDMLPSVHHLLRLYMTIPISSATSERTFSAMRRLMTYLRSSMTEKRLNHCLLLHIHKLKTLYLNLMNVWSILVIFLSSNIDCSMFLCVSFFNNQDCSLYALGMISLKAYIIILGVDAPRSPMKCVSLALCWAPPIFYICLRLCLGGRMKWSYVAKAAGSAGHKAHSRLVY